VQRRATARADPRTLSTLCAVLLCVGPGCCVVELSVSIDGGNIDPISGTSKSSNLSKSGVNRC
jgi:hypothetical protein